MSVYQRQSLYLRDNDARTDVLIDFRQRISYWGKKPTSVCCYI